MISSSHCLIPVPEEYLDNYAAWKSLNYGESAFSFYPICNKEIFTKFTYKCLLGTCYNRVAAWGGALIRTSFLTTGFFEDPYCQCITTEEAALKLISKIPDDFPVSSSISEGITRLTKLLHDHCGELVSTYVTAKLHISEAAHWTLYNAVKDVSEQYKVDMDTILSALSAGCAMLSYNGLLRFESYANYEYNLHPIPETLKVTHDDTNYTMSVKPTSDFRKAQWNNEKEDHKLMLRIHRKLTKAFYRYENQFSRYLRQRKKYKAGARERLQRPVLDPIFLYYSYVKFKYKKEVVRL